MKTALFVIQSLASFIGNLILLKLYDSYVWFKKRILSWSVKLVLFIAVMALLNSTFSPVIKAYHWSLGERRSMVTATSNQIVSDKSNRSKLQIQTHSVIMHTDNWLNKFTILWQQNSLVKILSLIAPSLAKIQFSLGLTGYHLGIAEQLDWNLTMQRVFAKYIKEHQVEFKNLGGWALPVAKVDTKRELRDLIALYRSPARFYFTENSGFKVDKIKGIYISGSSTRQKILQNKIRYLKRVKANAVVFDIKDVIGFVNYKSDIRMVNKIQGRIRPPIGQLITLTDSLREKKVYGVARVALFQDEMLVKNFPEMGIVKKNGSPLMTGRRRLWVDPGKKEVQQYNLKIIWEVLQSGANEIQLDYVRYPAEGDWKSARYYNIKEHFEKPKMITQFLQKVFSLTRAYGAKLSLDVFGVVAWQEKLDIKSTGQNMVLLAQAADVISPMLYPSHFGKSFAGINNPADSPYHFIVEGSKKMRRIVPENVAIRPWLQAFRWRVTNYNSSYIEKQIQGAYATGAYGFLLWNARNKYLPYRDVPYRIKEVQ